MNNALSLILKLAKELGIEQMLKEHVLNLIQNELDAPEPAADTTVSGQDA